MQLPLIFAKITVTYPESDTIAVRVLLRELELIAEAHSGKTIIFSCEKRL